VYIEIRPKRFRCPFCDDHPTTTQQLVWYTPKAPYTKAYERLLLITRINSTIADVSHKEDTLPDAVLGVLDRWIDAAIDWAAVPAFAVLGIDEIALKKGHRDFVVIVTAQRPHGALHLLAVLPDRTTATVRTWLASIPTRGATPDSHGLYRYVDGVCDRRGGRPAPRGDRDRPLSCGHALS